MMSIEAPGRRACMGDSKDDAWKTRGDSKRLKAEQGIAEVEEPESVMFAGGFPTEHGGVKGR